MGKLKNSFLAMQALEVHYDAVGPVKIYNFLDLTC